MSDKFTPEINSDLDLLKVLTAILNKNFDVEEKLTQSIKDLSETMTQVRLSIGGIQSEIKTHSEIIQRMSNAIDEMKDTTVSITTIQTQINEHEKNGLESRRRINERLDDCSKRIGTIEKKVENIDDKGKVDLVKIGAQFFIYVFGGSGLFALLFWIFEQISTK